MGDVENYTNEAFYEMKKIWRTKAFEFCNVEEIEAIEASKQENDDFKAKLDVRTCIQDTLRYINGMKSYDCDQFTDSSINKGHLLRHIRIVHQKIRDYQCTQCKYATG